MIQDGASVIRCFPRGSSIWLREGVWEASSRGSASTGVVGEKVAWGS